MHQKDPLALPTPTPSTSPAQDLQQTATPSRKATSLAQQIQRQQSLLDKIQDRIESGLDSGITDRNLSALLSSANTVLAQLSKLDESLSDFGTAQAVFSAMTDAMEHLDQESIRVFLRYFDPLQSILEEKPVNLVEHYVKLGLIPPPDRAGSEAENYYTEPWKLEVLERLGYFVHPGTSQLGKETERLGSGLARAQELGFQGLSLSEEDYAGAGGAEG